MSSLALPSSQVSRWNLLPWNRSKSASVSSAAGGPPFLSPRLSWIVLSASLQQPLAPIMFVYTPTILSPPRPWMGPALLGLALAGIAPSQGPAGFVWLRDHARVGQRPTKPHLHCWLYQPNLLLVLAYQYEEMILGLLLPPENMVALLLLFSDLTFVIGCSTYIRDSP
ncbi:hypothetical protein SODALDRAFT_361824 [Sodiomyces alkalinus F11]|uniref:Uncharacterized protein n=1 Tax=Sodiomyces alkalinus (strain CBS 110278 / VKM F-3762 / F11) TaxID=1314773 RepID=A0A3N2PRJ5_SODAK|nr:hypothetical protein SODALDRAFT_361824 [Sodiomyces alkalinus F11]ROT36976.1 hypothetical protein SODALDRAFT_361824 [Sodiomyces alkalinus F11]